MRKKINSPLTSALFTVGYRWLSKLLGVISTIVLARLLVPEDFGIVAMASVVVGFADVLVSMGTNVALINKKDATESDFDTAWTIRILQSSAAACLIVSIAPSAGTYFNDDRVTPVMYLMAMTIFIGGFENIWIVRLVKNMEFGREFQFRLSQRLITFFITICLAIYLRNYWAMTLGALISRVVGVAVSYYYHKSRPSFSLKSAGEIWHVSKWILLQNIGHYSYRKLDEVLLGGRVDSAALGTYTLAKEISSMPTSELLAPIGRVLYPMFVNTRDAPAELQRTYFLSMGLQATFVVPAAVGLAMISETLVPVLLGDKWASAVPILGILAFGGMLTGLSHSTSYLLMTLRHFRFIALLPWVNLSLLAILAFLVFPAASTIEFAYITLFLSAIQCLATLGYAVISRAGLSIGGLFRNTWRPIVSSLAMAWTLSLFNDKVSPSVFHLVEEILAGVFTYTFSILLLWVLARKPDGAESYVVLNLAKSLRKLRA